MKYPINNLVNDRNLLVFLLAIIPLLHGCVSSDPNLPEKTSDAGSGVGKSFVALEQRHSYERVVLDNGYKSVWILEIDEGSRFRSQLRVLGDLENCLFVFYQYWTSIDRATPPSFRITDEGIVVEVLHGNKINTFVFPLLRNMLVCAWQEEGEGELWPVPLGENEAKSFFNSVRPPRNTGSK